MEDISKRVFISYSWSVQERVIELAERLIANRIDVILDVYDLKEGQDKYAFMEQSVNDPSVSRVLIICDKTYTEKANSRSGGVGDETVIVSPEIYGQMKQEKFIPIIFETDESGKAFCPSFIKSRIYIDLSTEDDRYEVEYEKLLRNIYEKPLYKKPALGVKPEWLENDTVSLSAIRDLIKQIRGYTGGNQSKADFLLRKAVDEFIETAKLYTLSQDKPVDEVLLQVIDQSKGYRDLFVDYCEALIYSELPISKTIPFLFERLYNELHDATAKGSYSNFDFEVYDFLIWELFISITAVLLHFEKYMELYNILTHTYFLRDSFFSSTLKACDYTYFRAFCRTIEETCKKKCSNPRLFTLMGDILIKREKKPILTKESLTNADLILYQIYNILSQNGEGRGYWYPMTYIYHQQLQPIWQRLKSKQFCNVVQPLLGVSNITDLKDVIKKGDEKMNISGYSGSFETPLSILRNIKIEEIGSVN
jgi:hypothetical protein